ncbi:protein kinase domain containing protein [Entamoeba histolytica HM-1:IMSS-B]|uniref:Calcium-dependent protein kinase, putative n=3 Tax=Entamoeba histolytica TaxID=5759 RepID=C4LYQ2_ENTH1|nr:calcium-dependent protein kinase, putative [Entamoeba histolytica HM-1:IMSS]EAL46865.1 calcium-dependent protein kinase, putative [Entamoeba histolytica HM-1:IMSS]EMH75499.1 protein kinase domain containing protein [Entamoeba histolytica HM-1:IMSS-B]GAT93960.1 protein kinase domain containing protein [Entamoeba histolytica]|eukprot:XP_652252.1 calcium-dependent protein kinase, putative [Entamoeba histolytica HM-1:IMSS]
MSNMTWGILIGLESTTPNILLKEEVENIGRERIDKEKYIISSNHFTITRRQQNNESQCFILTDTSSNGTFLNDENKRLEKKSETVINSFDVIYVVKVCQQENTIIEPISFLFIDTLTFNTINSKTQLFDKYKFGKLLGCGSFGKVFQVITTNEKSQKRALKIIPIKNKVQMIKNEREFEITKSIKHPNIVEVIDMMESEHWSFIVMELIETGCLLDYLYKHQLTNTQLKSIMKDVLEAISFLHKNFIVHRDIKLENVLIEQHELSIIAKLTDFGLGRIVGKDFQAETLCGTRQYVSPEIYKRVIYKQKINNENHQEMEESLKRKLSYDASKSDIWACGIMFYEMILRRSPFDGTLNESDKALGYKRIKLILNADFNKDDKYLKLSQEIRDLLENMIVADPHKRLSAEECLQLEYFTRRTITAPTLVPNKIESPLH